jgi:hypothetical protein
VEISNGGFYPKRTCKTTNQVLNEVEREESEEDSRADINLAEYIKGELFDYALFVGMSSDEYWFGDPSLIYNYQNAFDKRQEYDLLMAWTYGAYFKSALGSTQLWTTQPTEKSDWNKMPNYVECPVKKKEPPKEQSEETKDLIKKAKAKLTMYGLLGD